MQRVQVSQQTITDIRAALHKSHEDEQAYHEAQTEALEAQEKALQRRLDQIYIDKLDGKIGEDFWREKTEQWRSEQDEIHRKLNLHKSANRRYIDEGIKILELAQYAHARYVAGTAEIKGQILRFLLSNCTLKDATPSPTYRKPFSLVAKGPLCEIWRGRRDDLRTADPTWQAFLVKFRVWCVEFSIEPRL